LIIYRSFAWCDAVPAARKGEVITYDLSRPQS
jgi:hypothetical protein